MNLPLDIGLRPAAGRHLYLVPHHDFWITIRRKCWISVSIKGTKYLVHDDLDTHGIAGHKIIYIPALLIGVERLLSDASSSTLDVHLADIVILSFRHG